MKLKNTISTAIAISAVIVALAGCQKEAGPAEKAGKAVDNATEKAGQQIEKAGDNIQDAAKGNKK
jgi:PBP1b-binding outer membrane lipoprotein LpoB